MSTHETLLAYLRERMRPSVFVPLALACAFTGWLLAPGLAFDASAFFLAALHAFVLSLAFRVWDDLEDRNADRIRHPHRVMARSTRTAPFLWLVALLAVVGLTSFLQLNDPLPRAIAIATAAGALTIWYSARRSENWNHVAGEHIVLTKYPAIAFATAPTIPDASSFIRTSVLLAALYAVICIYEYIDDPELRHMLSSRRSLP